VYLYQHPSNGSFVRYQKIENVFEKTEQLQRDAARQMMPIDLHTWSISNFNASLLMYSEFKVLDGAGTTLFEYRDTEGAVHVTLAQNEYEAARGNNHQTSLSSFLIAQGEYKLVYKLAPESKGKPSLMLWRQRPENLFLILVGSNPSGVEQGNADGPDGYLVSPGEQVERSFAIQFVDQDNVLYKSNANGFEFN